MNQVNFDFPWGHNKRYNDFPTHFKKLFNERVQKVSVDAGFTCPNRDGTKGLGGCIYCNNVTFKPSYCHLEKSVTTQINEGISFFEKKYKTMKYLAYFQAYTNTYAPIENLIDLYQEALNHPAIVGLVIATRPDCLSESILDYLAEIARHSYVMVELGVESCENLTLERINRGHTFEDSVEAFKQLKFRNIHSCAHMILGLPGEDRKIILRQAQVLSQLPIETIKLHQLQVHRNTVLAKQFNANPAEFKLFETVQEYIDIVIEYLELLNPEFIVERFISQAPSDLLIAPRWGLKNFEFVAKLEKALELRNTWQGRLFGQ